MESRYKYAVFAAGAVAKCLIGKLPSKTGEVGPVAAVSYRVASRIANTLRAGYPVRAPDELDAAAVILFHAPPEQTEILLKLLERAGIHWAGKALVFCDCDGSPAVRSRFEALGATTAVARQFGIPGRIAISGSGLALATAQRIARALKLKPVEVLPGAIDLFDAAVTLASPAITPLVDCAASLLRAAGIRDTDAARIASALFQQTAKDYARSGKQSWAWYIRQPDMEGIERQIAAAGARAEPVMRQLLRFAFEFFDKYPDARAALTAAGAASKSRSSRPARPLPLAHPGSP
ncbi:MAG TPA: DUF2520 domain-containing protein [Bryobacteraceae bacterium]|nr:DUF2520 domain-containing protein [Bryobacteraceae bacterium]